jgi:hypothetical protein
VKLAGRYAPQLLRFGMTAGTVFEATVGVSLLADRVLQETPSSRGEPSAVFPLRAKEGDDDEERFEQLMAQIRGTPTSPPDAAPSLLRWISAVAQERPLLFERYRAFSFPDERLVLVPDKTYDKTDLSFRWSRPAGALSPQPPFGLPRREITDKWRD